MLPKMSSGLVQRGCTCLAIVLLSVPGALFAATIPEQIDVLREQSIAMDATGQGDAGYLSAAAQAWLDFGFEEYVEKDSQSLVQFVLHRVPQLIEAARNGKQPPDEMPPVGDRIRPDLWQKLAEGKASPQFDCAASGLGRLEVALHWAAHELHELGPRHARRYVDDAENYARQAQQQAQACRTHVQPQAADRSDATGAGMAGSAADIGIQLIQLPAQVHFAFDSADLGAASIAILQRLSAVLHTYPSLKLQVIGHADLSGGESYNDALSQRRAEQVRNWLVASGLSADRFATTAMGKRYPLMPSRGTINGAYNRRVEFVVLDVQAIAAALEVTSNADTSDLQPYESGRPRPRK